MALLPPPDIGAAYVEEKSGRATTSFYNWVRSLYDYVRGITNNTLFAPLVTVAALPPAGVKGRRHFVTDATSITFSSIATGGGVFNVPVFDDGTNWRVG